MTIPRVRCEQCRRFRWKDKPCKCKAPAQFYVPEVDGTLGSEFERQNGGPTLNEYGEVARGGYTDLLRGKVS